MNYNSDSGIQSGKTTVYKEETKQFAQLVCKRCTGEEIIELATKTKQKINPGPADKSLDHLKESEEGITKLADWAKARSYNAALEDMTKVKCYVCGGPGHFYEVCPMHRTLSLRFGVHGLR